MKPAPDDFGLVGPFTAIARAMSNQWNVRIVPSGSECKTDGETIWIPFTADLLSEEKRDSLHGHLDHEIAHVAEEVRHKELGLFTYMQRVEKIEDKRLRLLMNTFEDVRIEHRYSAIYPGMAEHLHAANVDSVEKKAAAGVEDLKKDFWMSVCSAVILGARGHEVEWAREEPFSRVIEILEKEIEDCQSPGDTCDWTAEIAARAFEKIKDEWDEDDAGPSPASMPAVEDMMDVSRNELSEYVVRDAKENRRYIPHPKSKAADTITTPSSLDVDTYHRASVEVREQTHVIRRRYRVLLQAQKRSRIIRGRDSGDIDGDALPDVGIGSFRCFTETTRAKALNTAVMCLVDVSGSMGTNVSPHHCAYYALRTVVALAETWESIGVPNEILGYSTHEDSDCGLVPEDRDGPFFCRAPLDLIVLKAYEERLRLARGRLSQIRGRGSNVDGESLLWAGSRLLKRSEPRKVLLVVCDGRPLCSDGLPYDSRDCADDAMLQQHLRDSISELTRRGVEVICAGAGVATPGAYYNESTGSRFVHISDVRTMATGLVKVMEGRVRS